MKSFVSFVSEEKDKSAVLLFGRMNPITSGHEENVNAAHSLASKHDAHLHVERLHQPSRSSVSICTFVPGSKYFVLLY
jgi:hypothetical protein